MAKYVFVTGGVLSSVGKGVSVASLGRILNSRSYKVGAQKLDPYLNAEPGIMSPAQHGELFVTKDGAATDLDLGHYERFIGAELSRFSSVTAGQVYRILLENERRGDYLGGTIQVVPQLTDEIKRLIRRGADANEADIAIVDTITTSTGWIGPNLYIMLQDNAANITTAVTGATFHMMDPVYICNLVNEKAMLSNWTASTHA